MASVAGQCPASVSTHPVSPSGCPAVRCPAVRCPVTWVRRLGVRRSGRLLSPRSGVQPSGVQPAGVRPSSVQPAGVRPVGPDASVSSHTRRWRWPGSLRRAPVTPGPGRVPVGCRAVGQLGRRPRTRTRATLPGRARSGRAAGGLAGWVRAAVAARDRLSDQAGRRAERRGWRRREVAAPAAWLPCWVGWATTLGGGRGAGCRGGRTPEGPMGLLAGWGAAPARPGLAAGAPGSLPAAL
jgi:hypothetical protein